MIRRGVTGPEIEAAGVDCSLFPNVCLLEGECWNLSGAEVSSGQPDIHPERVCYFLLEAARQTRLPHLDVSQLVSPHLPAPPPVPANIHPLLHVLDIVRQLPGELKPLYLSHQILHQVIFPPGRQAVHNMILLGQNKLDDPLLLSQYETLETAGL